MAIQIVTNSTPDHKLTTGRLGQAVSFVRFGKDSTGHLTMRLYWGTVKLIDGDQVWVETDTDLHRTNALNIREWQARVRRVRVAA